MAHKGMVVTPQPEATETGRDILAAGGNAIDAAIATALVQTVVDPLMCGIAGFGSLAVYSPSKGVHTYYDFHSPAPGGVRPAMWESLIEGEARDGYGFVLKGNVNDIGFSRYAYRRHSKPMLKHIATMENCHGLNCPVRPSPTPKLAGTSARTSIRSGLKKEGWDASETPNGSHLLPQPGSSIAGS